MNLDEYVVSYGEFGKCDNCENASEETACIRGKRYCKDCKNEKQPKSSAEFQESDATFKCRERACSADNLSYRECAIGVCCETALKSDPGNDTYYYHCDDDDEPEAKKKKQNEDNEKPSCKVCFFPFDNDHPEAVIIPCGHKACFNCISKLPEKDCPSCRAKFSDENVYKVYN
ncbi:Oidioi.mRNA.OKI2018_I69.PAR.g12859.t1.cds [Oikopleura dioica]|uniref:Oidioi.mRNA.OKI2018_I69.PAR.g12859.t1.cds n=1 Tax=Oikopleura dioica TaxID=34765 RepID=A0ABN7S5V4_OIKDI|nr:Oidioi.mRNA.OKI2018_I69.PAR.g12859.t1.cds [Oikopleura dioica]